jgi:ribosomal subunit interface protein
MVDIQITGVRYSVSDKIREYITQKLGGLKRFHPELNRLHVTIHEAEKKGFRIDVEMHLPSSKDVIAHDEEETVYSAVDCVADKCAAQLRRLHGKQQRKSSQPIKARA